jgi:hypothetical protein
VHCRSSARGALSESCDSIASCDWQVVDFTAGRQQQGGAARQGQAAGQPADTGAEAQQDEERFAALRKKAGKLARRERRTLDAKGDAAPQPRGFS